MYEIILYKTQVEPEIFSVIRKSDGACFSLGNFVYILSIDRKFGPLPITRISISESNDEIIIETGTGFQNYSRNIQLIDGPIDLQQTKI